LSDPIHFSHIPYCFRKLLAQFREQATRSHLEMSAETDGRRNGLRRQKRNSRADEANYPEHDYSAASKIQEVQDEVIVADDNNKNTSNTRRTRLKRQRAHSRESLSLSRDNKDQNLLETRQRKRKRNGEVGCHVAKRKVSPLSSL